MAEISNKMLAALLGGLIVISLISLFVTISKLSSPGVTGYASSQGIGITNVTVASTTYINITDDYIYLGVLEPGDTNNSELANDWWTVENAGSVPINVSVYDSGTSPFSGTGCSTIPNSCYQVHGYSSQSGSTDSAYTNMPASAGTMHQVCGDLSFTDSIDECVVGIKMTIPADEPAGDKTATATIVAEASS
jgi:hypothetical protein